MIGDTRVLVAPLAFALIVVVPVVLLNAPLLAMLWIARRRLDRRVRGTLLAAGFGAAAAYRTWRPGWTGLRGCGMARYND